MERSFLDKIVDSMFGENTYILLAAVITSVCLATALFMKHHIQHAGHPKKSNNLFLYRIMRVLYEVFLTGITIFPLLGLFGTVKALLSLDFANDLAGAQSKFFDALTSTACGIIFAVLFKFINAWVAPSFERVIEMEEHYLRGEFREKRVRK